MVFKKEGQDHIRWGLKISHIVPKDGDTPKWKVTLKMKATQKIRATTKSKITPKM